MSLICDPFFFVKEKVELSSNVDGLDLVGRGKMEGHGEGFVAQ